MKPSKYQLKILDWLKNGHGHAICNAVAGSGKTTTLKLAAGQLESMGLKPSELKVIVFGKQNSLDLIDKFGPAWKNSIQTLHSVGFRIVQQEIGRLRRDERVISTKYRRIAENFQLIPQKTKKRTFQGQLINDGAISKAEPFLKLIDLVRLTLSDVTEKSLRHLTYHHNLEGINDFKKVTEALAKILIVGQEEALDHRLDYTDMIWLPVKWQLYRKNWFRTYKFVLIDECQDLNAAQLELSLMLAGPRGRMLYVGDPRQAIYGFSGADNRSYQKIVERTKATELPLSLCYRCPKSHLDLVNQIYPEIPIEATEDAAPGILKSLDKSALWNKKHPDHLVVGDMVLSRKTAPLVSLCIRLIGQGIAATVRGKDIGKQIKSELEAIADINGFQYKEFGFFVEQYKEFKFQTYESRDNVEQLKENLSDKLNALLTIYSSQPNATCVAHLCTYIDDLFSDEESPITLSTCHRAKGLEGERIFIIKPEDLPMSWERQLGWQKEQEDNLLYVALTRSQSALYIVGQPDWFKDEEDEFEYKQSIDVAGVMLLISSLFSFEDKCELAQLLSQEITQEKWQRVTAALLDNAARSDRAIASACGTSTPFVSKVRKNLIETKEIEVETSRVDKRGRKHKSPITSSTSAR